MRATGLTLLAKLPEGAGAVRYLFPDGHGLAVIADYGSFFVSKAGQVTEVSRFRPHEAAPAARSGAN